MKISAYEQELLDYLRSSLPLADRIVLQDEQLMQIVRHATSVREETPWGSSIPESVFRAFVVFPRSNNEDPVFYHGPLWEILKPRIQGKTMYEAVVEINYWTYEAATYQTTDGRTANALTLVKRAFGRCGEESVLLVSALRAAGIPARQTFVPRWAHCDDNHAWVEVWVDGKWYYLGACEPEPVLNSGWFTAAASKAMVVHTTAYGTDPEGDRVEGHAGNASLINRTEGYARCRVFRVKVVSGGAPCSGVTVRFELANSAEFYPVHSSVTDENGMAEMLCGFGTLHLHVHDGEKYVSRMVDAAESDFCEVDFGQAVGFVREKETFDQRPPLETRIQPTEFEGDVSKTHKRRLAECEAIRAEREASFPAPNAYYANARGNYRELEKFLGCGRFAMEDKTALLDTLREKDFVDLDAETMCDVLETALEYRGKYPFEIWQQGVLCPRVRNEMLYPVRAYLKNALEAQGAEADAQAIWALLKERTEICEMKPETLAPDLRAVWNSRKASPAVLDVLFVAAARALGVAARLNPVSGEKEYFAGGWQALLPSRRMDSKLVLVNRTGRKLEYFGHFSVGRLEGGAFRTLYMEGTSLEDRLEIPVLSGRYRVMTCTRQIDGSVDGLLIPLEIAPGETVEAEVEMRPERTKEKLLHEKLPPLATKEQTLPEADRRSILAVIDPGAEPTEHFLNELLDERAALESEGIAVRLIITDAGRSDNEKLRRVLREVQGAQLFTEPDGLYLMNWRRMLRAGDLRRPFALAVDEHGEGLFAYSNYNVGSVRSLVRILSV